MGNMFKHTPLAAEARITALERELAALRAASAEIVAAYAAWYKGISYLDDDANPDLYDRLGNARATLEALLGEGETDG